MKPEIHPQYYQAQVKCACGNKWQTGATVPEFTLEICSNCHPFYTGKQKTLDTRGRITKFKERAAKAEAKAPKKTRAKKTDTPAA